MLNAHDAFLLTYAYSGDSLQEDILSFLSARALMRYSRAGMGHAQFFTDGYISLGVR